MNDKALVVKANQLIEAKYKLGLSEQKIVLSYISRIKATDKDFKEYSFSVDDVKEFLGWSKNTKSLYDELYHLSEQIFLKPLGIKEGKAFTYFNWFSKIRFDGSTLTLRSDPDLKPYLLQLKGHFTKYQLKNVVKLKSIYSIRLYELAKQYESIGCRRFGLDELKETLGIKEKYAQYGNFKKRVLEPAEKDINKNTDISISYSTVKTGRKVTGIEFCIVWQGPGKKRKAIPSKILNMIPEAERAASIDLVQAVFNKHGENGLIFYLEKCNARKKTKNGNYSGYLKTIVDMELYADVKEAREAQAQAEKKARDAEKAKAQMEAKDQAQKEKKHKELEVMLKKVDLVALDAFIKTQNLTTFEKKRLKQGKPDSLRVKYIKKFVAQK